MVIYVFPTAALPPLNISILEEICSPGDQFCVFPFDSTVCLPELVCSAFGPQKRVLEPPELELQVPVTHHVGALLEQQVLTLNTESCLQPS